MNEKRFMESNIMSEERISIKMINFHNKFGLGIEGRDYRATVGSLKKALENFNDDLPIGVLYDTEMAYCDLYEIFVGDDGLVRLVGD